MMTCSHHTWTSTHSMKISLTDDELASSFSYYITLNYVFFCLTFLYERHVKIALIPKSDSEIIPLNSFKMM